MSSLSGGQQNQPHIDPILTLSQKVSDALSLGVVHEQGEDDVAPTISSANSILPSNQPGFQSFAHGVSILTADGGGTITGGHADIALQSDDTRAWTIDLSHGPDAVVLGGGVSTVHFGGSATIQAGSGDAMVKAGKGDLTFVGGSGASTVLGGQGATTIFGGSGTLMATGGQHGNDLFITGSGSETLTGGGADTAGQGHTTFEVIKGQTTNLTIKDFTAGDKVEFDGYSQLEVSQAHLSMSGGSSTVTLSDNTKITFADLHLKNIN
jgi:Ca2+-binding RTX toxin-like protein